MIRTISNKTVPEKKNTVIYFTCETRKQAEKTEAELRESAASLGYNVIAVLYDRSDKQPAVLLELAAHRAGCFSYLFVPGRSTLDFGSGLCEAVAHRFLGQGVRTASPEEELTSSVPPLVNAVRNYYSIGGNWMSAYYGSFVLRHAGQGRSSYGYEVRNGFNTVLKEEAEVVEDIFTMYADLVPVSVIANRIRQKYPDRSCPDRAHIYSLICCERYAGAADSGRLRYPPIIQNDLWLNCLAVSERNRAGREAPHRFFETSFCSNSGNSLLPAYEIADPDRPVYAAKQGETLAVYDAVLLEDGAADALKNAFSAEDGLCEETVDYIRMEKLKAAEDCAIIGSCMRRIDAEVEEGKPMGLPTRRSVEECGIALARAETARIAFEYAEYRRDFFELSEEKVIAFFLKIARLDELSRAEKAYFVKTFVRSVTVFEGFIEADIPALGRRERLPLALTAETLPRSCVRLCK